MSRQVTTARWCAASVCAILLALGVFLLPYHVPVVPTISLSYLVGFNNRVALICFLLGAFGVALSLRGWIGEPDSRDSTLPKGLLWGSLLATACLCIALRVHRSHMAIGGEAQFFLDREYQLMMHKIPYSEFEYTYGPIFLYLPHLVHLVFHIQPVPSYYIVWGIFWCLGVSMFYYVIANIDIPTRHRFAVYLLSGFTIPAAIFQEGINFAPLRLMTIPFLALCVYRFWTQTQSPYKTAFVSWFAILFAFGVSADQGVGLSFGLVVYLSLLTFLTRQYPVKALLLQVFLTAGLVLAAWHFKLLLAMQSFSLGGYNFPLLPSPVNLFVLFLYVCAICLVWRAALTRDLRHNHVLLTLCGIPILSSAMGRCDTGHLISASGAYLVGLFAIHSRRNLGRFVVPALWLLLFVSFYGPWLADHYHNAKGDNVSNSPLRAPGRVAKPIPNDRTYYSPFSTSISVPRLGYVPFQIEEGFYSGVENLTNPQQMTEKLSEMQSRKGMPLVLPDTLTPAAPQEWDTEVGVLRSYEMSPFVPRIKHSRVSTQVLTDFILRHYRPTDMVQDERRVWEYIPGS